MPRLATLAIAATILISGSTAAQGLIYVLGGLPVGGEATAENKTKLGLPIVAVGLETSGFGPVRPRLTIHYGLDWALFKDPCAECSALGPVLVDPAKNKKRPPLGASTDLIFEVQLSDRLAVGAFAGLGLAQSQRGEIERNVPDDYRIETHITPFITGGAEVTANVYKRLDAIVRGRYAHFSVGEHEITQRFENDPTQFTIDNGSVGGFIVMFGLRIQSRRVEI